jgi:hypothetical protein
MRWRVHMRNTVQRDDYGTELWAQWVNSLAEEFVWSLTIERAHPNQPKNVRVSLRNMDDRIAHMTTDNAPSGVLKTRGFQRGQIHEI